MKEKKVVFMGTPDFAVPVLEMLIKNTNVILVVTKPDKEVGRKHELKYSPVKECAIKENIPVFQPVKIKEDYEILKNMDIDLIVTCAYGQIIPKSILDMPKFGCVNVHASLLPKYRGSAPIQWAIFNGEEETGITIMYMDEGMDTGNIISQSKIKIDESDNVGTVHEKLSYLGTKTLESTLPSIFDLNAKSIPQGNDFTLAPMIKREMESIDFTDKGQNIINKIRGLNPWPVAYFKLKDIEIKVYEAKFLPGAKKEVGCVSITKDNFEITCQDGKILLQKIKPSGKKIMNIKEFLNGLNKDKYQGVKISNE